MDVTQEFSDQVTQTLQRVEDALQEVAVAENPFVTEAARHITNAGGKRFRPLLVVLASLLGEKTDASNPVIAGLTRNPHTPDNGEVADYHNPSLRGASASERRGNPSTDSGEAADASNPVIAGLTRNPHTQGMDRLIAACLVMELTHVASLYHDDVMDEASLRRGQTSANLRYGNSIAILVGDYLFARASSLVSILGVDYVAKQADTFARMVQGQIAELQGAPEDGDPMAHYLNVLADKTASLIGTSAVFGGMVGGLGQEDLARLEAFGEELGIVFQLRDDLLDITSDVSGKIPGTDLREGVATLPVLLLGASDNLADTILYDQIMAGIPEPDLAAVVETLRAHPVIALAQAEIVRRANLARAHLEGLPEGPALDALRALCDEATARLG